MKKLILILFLFVNISCQSFDNLNESKKKISVDYGLTPPALAKSYEKGVKYLDAEDYERAIEQFEYLISKYPSSPLTMAMYYNTGAAYEGLKDCKKAGKNFRNIVRATNQENDKIQAMALVRLSYAYECLGTDKKVITSLLDAKNRDKELDRFVAKAEVPARIAGAYGRMGNEKLEQKFLNLADKGLHGLRDSTQPAAKQRDELARSLYFMGRYWYKGFSIKNHSNILKTFEKSQVYLVRAVELDSPNWSSIAAKNLIEVYQFVWVYLNKALDSGKARGESVSREQINSLAIHALQGLRTLKTIRLPDKNPPQLVKGVFAGVDKLDKDYSDFLSKNNLGSALSSRRISGHPLKRQGRTINPNPKLEKRMKEMKKQKVLRLKPSN